MSKATTLWRKRVRSITHCPSSLRSVLLNLSFLTTPTLPPTEASECAHALLQAGAGCATPVRWGDRVQQHADEVIEVARSLRRRRGLGQPLEVLQCGHTSALHVFP